MAFVTGAIVGGIASLAGGLLSSNAASSAADAQVAAANKATKLQREQWLKQLELNKPFYEAGLKGQEALLNYLGIGGDPNAPGYGAGMKPFDASMMYLDPGYQFRLKEGLTALDKQAAAKGGLISGNALRAANRYGQDYASNEYNTAFKRYWDQRNQILNPMQSLLGQGQTTAANLGNAGQTYATNAGNTIQAAGQARASGYVGNANALNSALQNIGNQYMNYNLMNSYMNPPVPQGAPDMGLDAAYRAAGSPLPPPRPY
jgi:hypothetical protein